MMLASPIAIAAMLAQAAPRVLVPPPIRMQPLPAPYPPPPVLLIVPPAPPHPTHHARLVSGSITRADYPSEALAVEAEGTVLVRLTIAKTGAVTGCLLLASSGYPILDRTTCTLAQQRFRFEPGRDARGRKAADTAAARIVWRIEEEPAEPAEANPPPPPPG
jgi:protein TonB